MIHRLALVEPGARVAPDAEVGPFAVVESGAVVGAGCSLAAHAVVRSHARLAAGVRVDSFAVVGGDPQDLGFDRARATTAEIGAGTVLREHVTVHRGTAAGGTTRVGAGCLLMAGAHVAHDCAVGDGAILANGCMLGGHVEVGERAFVSGGVAVHQFCRVGEGSMTSGNAVVTGDIPPFALAHGRDELAGLNLVGLRRRGLPAATVAELKQAFRLAFAEGSSCEASARAALASGAFASPEARRFLEFFLAGRRGRFAQPTR
jgi:UDP-N-acetylglucosamine acyltransferase